MVLPLELASVIGIGVVKTRGDVELGWNKGVVWGPRDVVPPDTVGVVNPSGGLVVVSGGKGVVAT